MGASSAILVEILQMVKPAAIEPNVGSRGASDRSLVGEGKTRSLSASSRSGIGLHTLWPMVRS